HRGMRSAGWSPALLVWAYALVLRLHVALGLLEGGLGGGEAGDGDAERRRTHVVQAGLMTELDAARVAAVLATNAELDVRARLAAALDRGADQLADALPDEDLVWVDHDDAAPAIVRQ